MEMQAKKPRPMRTSQGKKKLRHTNAQTGKTLRRFNLLLGEVSMVAQGLATPHKRIEHQQPQQDHNQADSKGGKEVYQDALDC
jgi:hypothetical protein